MPNPTQNEYIARINKVFDYVENNIGKQFTLQDLAEVASFSKYHFNRIFYGVVGETPFQFITRVRLERAASLLLSAKNDSITEIACKCGFNDISIFSRNFKSFFGLSASQYRQGNGKNSNFKQVDSNKKQHHKRLSTYFCFETKTLKWKMNMEQNKSVEIKDLPKMTLAYIRHIGPYKGDEKLFEKLWNKLFAWAGPRNLIGGPDFKSLIIYHDDPNVTVEDKLRMSVCITVSPATKVDGEVGKMEVEAAKYVVARFVLDATQFGEAWQWLYGVWFPSSGYQPDDKPCFEMYPEEPKDGKFTVDICVPVKPL
jgi:AraC family transcriptional regulator